MLLMRVYDAYCITSVWQLAHYPTRERGGGAAKRSAKRFGDSSRWAAGQRVYSKNEHVQTNHTNQQWGAPSAHFSDIAPSLWVRVQTRPLFTPPELIENTSNCQ